MPCGCARLGEAAALARRRKGGRDGAHWEEPPPAEAVRGTWEMGATIILPWGATDNAWALGGGLHDAAPPQRGPQRVVVLRGG